MQESSIRDPQFNTVSNLGKKAPPPSSRWRRLLRNPFFWGTVTGLVAIPAMRPLLRHVPEPPPVLMQLPAFTLTNQAGQRFGSAQLRGHVYLVNFFFTRCPSICPKLTKAMHSLQERYDRTHEPVRLVSISVDPDNDTPAVLAKYAAHWQADTDRWTFLTGSTKQVHDLIIGGFKTHLGKKHRTAAGAMEIAHTGNLALIDQHGRLRGFYPTDDNGLDEIFHRSLHVLHSDS